MISDVAKYDPLYEHLISISPGPVEMTFTEVGQLVGGLPRSARTRQWWENESPGGTHVQARGWRNAGRKVEWVDLGSGVVRFSARSLR
jgi:hypothetical protein